MSSLINTSGSFSFGERAKSVLYIPTLISVTIILVVLSITGIFKPKKRR